MFTGCLLDFRPLLSYNISIRMKGESELVIDKKTLRNVFLGVGGCILLYWLLHETDRVEYMYEQPFFKEALWDLTKLVIDGVSSKEALVDQRIVFNEKGNNGQYAVLYGWDTPSVFELKDKDFGYRKVYLTIPQERDKFLFAESEMGGSGSRHCHRPRKQPFLLSEKTRL